MFLLIDASNGANKIFEDINKALQEIIGQPSPLQDFEDELKELIR